MLRSIKSTRWALKFHMGSWFDWHLWVYEQGLNQNTQVTGTVPTSIGLMLWGFLSSSHFESSNSWVTYMTSSEASSIYSNGFSKESPSSSPYNAQNFTTGSQTTPPSWHSHSSLPQGPFSTPSPTPSGSHNFNTRSRNSPRPLIGGTSGRIHWEIVANVGVEDLFHGQGIGAMDETDADDVAFASVLLGSTELCDITASVDFCTPPELIAPLVGTTGSKIWARLISLLSAPPTAPPTIAATRMFETIMIMTRPLVVR